MQSIIDQRHLTSAMFVSAYLAFATMAIAQDQPASREAEGGKQARESIEIANEPKTVDPATLIPAELVKPTTVKFDGQPLKEVFAWLQKETSIGLTVDYRALANAKILETDPIYEESKDAPLYLLLNRLDRFGLAWYVRDRRLNITSRDEYSKHDSTIPYNLGDLFDAGYSPQDLLRTITRCSGGRWDSENASGGSLGTAVLLGDVVFIRQTDNYHQEVAGLLSALKEHGRRTFTLDPPQHAALRSALDRKISVDFLETPLIVAIEEISRLAQINIRLDHVRERTPVTLKLNEQTLASVLKSLLSNPTLSWYLRDDALWIIASDTANPFQKTAVYDVRDLCKDRDEAVALKEAIKKQTRAKWGAGSDQNGILETPKPGILIARHTESMLDELLELLENYRAALRASKWRTIEGVDPKEIVVGYYRLTHSMANDLQNEIPKMIVPDSWQSPDRPDAVGSIRKISAQPTPIDAKGGIVENAVLIIRQSRSTHQIIGKLILGLESSRSVDVEAMIDTSRKPQSPTGNFGSNLIPK